MCTCFATVYTPWACRRMFSSTFASHCTASCSPGLCSIEQHVNDMDAAWDAEPSDDGHGGLQKGPLAAQEAGSKLEPLLPRGV